MRDCEIGPGDCDRAIRQALVGLWVPPSIEEKKATPRWHRRAANFDQISKGAVAAEG